MIAAIGKWWRRRQRAIDLDVLWPACKAGAPSLHDARGAFYVHCMLDPAWLRDFSEDEIIAAIERLS